MKKNCSAGSQSFFHKNVHILDTSILNCILTFKTPASQIYCQVLKCIHIENTITTLFLNVQY